MTANVEEFVRLSVNIINNVYLSTEYMHWEKQEISNEGFQIVPSSGNVLDFRSVTIGDAGVYATYWQGRRSSYLFSLIRLFVRGNLKSIIYST